MQQRMIDLCQHELQQMMETCLDASCPPDKIIRFKKVEIDIGNIDIDELRTEWLQRVINALRVALADALQKVYHIHFLFTPRQIAESKIMRYTIQLAGAHGCDLYSIGGCIL